MVVKEFSNRAPNAIIAVSRTSRGIWEAHIHLRITRSACHPLKPIPPHYFRANQPRNQRKKKKRESIIITNSSQIIKDNANDARLRRQLYLHGRAPPPPGLRDGQGDAHGVLTCGARALGGLWRGAALLRAGHRHHSLRRLFASQVSPPLFPRLRSVYNIFVMNLLDKSMIVVYPNSRIDFGFE